ncbi:MAG: hypothetical protein GX815_01545 [Clostridiales bacterium]|nr:hypothetical protein [Clostridiales bacterium]
MRKIKSITVIMLILLLAMPSFALASVQPQPESNLKSSALQPETQPQSLETGETPPPQNEESGIPVNLSIDNANVYEGMDRAYKDGYTPTVKNGKAIVVVPLLLEG